MARTATRDRPSHRCGECGLVVTKWLGQCPECQAWGSIGEVGVARISLAATPVSAPAQPIDEVDAHPAASRPTGVGELDRVLGGGLVEGAVVLLAGEPGVGKSTLLLEVAARAATQGLPTLYVSGEESVAQIRLRAGRTGGLDPHLWLAAETDLGAVLSHIAAVRPGLLVIDSVQTVASAAVEGPAGGVTQVRAVTAALVSVAKERGLPTLLVGHVTKDGSIAGPRTLEHLVDVVLQFEGERHSTLRLVRAVKNRFGPAEEVGCFTLTDTGIEGVPDPSGLFLSGRTDPVPGTCATVAVEGRRPMMAEVQALVAGAAQDTPPRRAVSGLDPARVAMVLAVVERRGDVRLGRADIFTATVGGARLLEPGADLAVALAVAGAARDTALPCDVLALGELGLSGEVRPLPGLSRRLAEAGRLGFRRALVPPGGAPGPAGMELIEVADVVAALRAMARLAHPGSDR